MTGKSLEQEITETLEEAEKWVAEYVSQMRAYTISEDAEQTLEKIHSVLDRASPKDQP